MHLLNQAHFGLDFSTRSDDVYVKPQVIVVVLHMSNEQVLLYR